MTTLTEFKEIEAKATKGPWRLDVKSHPFDEHYEAKICGDIFVLVDFNGPNYPHKQPNAELMTISRTALPALIAVAEAMAGALKNSRFIMIAEGIDDTGFVNEALAAFEAWEDNIEGEK